MLELAKQNVSSLLLSELCYDDYYLYDAINEQRTVGPLEQWSPTLGLQMFLDFNSQKAWPAKVVVKASGSGSLRTSGGPKFGTTALVGP